MTVSHGAFSGSYTAFDIFRQVVFRAAGYGDLNEVDGYTNPISWSDDSDDMAPASRTLLDAMPKSDGLYPLFREADDDGRIRSAALPPLARRLRDLADKAPDYLLTFLWEPNVDYSGLSTDGFRAGMLDFAAACVRAHAAGEDLVWDMDFRDEDELHPRRKGRTPPKWARRPGEWD